MHAKLTRDRKKSFIRTMEKLIEELQADVNRLKAVLAQVSSLSPSTAAGAGAGASATSDTGATAESSVVTPKMVSPELVPAKEPAEVLEDARDDVVTFLEEAKEELPPPQKRARHCFSLID